MENRVSDNIGREQVLALDVATKTGYYSQHESGTWNFAESKRRNGNKMHGAFRTMLLAYMRRLAELRGILLEVCDELDLPEPEFVNPATLKKFATGDGRATKEQMIRACREKYRYDATDDNAADACHLYHYYIRKYRI